MTDYNALIQGLKQEDREGLMRALSAQTKPQQQPAPTDMSQRLAEAEHRIRTSGMDKNGTALIGELRRHVMSQMGLTE